MSKILAIKGDKERGNEVIALLEMMGGDNSDTQCRGIEVDFYYYIDTYGRINYEDCFIEDEAEFFTLDEFYEKYSFKVGDKVIDDSGESGIIIEMKWDEEIIYKVDFGKECYYFTSDFLRPYKETSVKPSGSKCEITHEDVIFDSIIWHLRNSINNGKQNLSGGECEEYFREVVKKNNENKMKNVLAELLEHIKTTPKEDLEKEFEEIKEWSDVGPTVDEFRAFCESVNKKPKYPTSFNECKALLQLQDSIVGGQSGYEWRLISYFQQLLMCRDAYWKIAGEEMGLGKPWEPDWSSFSEDSYSTITKCNGRIVKTSIYTHDCPLAFPTEEMRDAFYENFKDLIEQCKKLL